MRIKKKLALLLASALLVTSINVMPVEASTSNQETGSENDNAVASMDLTLSIAALNSNQGNTVKNATGNTVLSLAVEELGENQGNTVKNATGSTNLTLQVEALNDNQGNTGKNATGSTTLTLVIGDQKKEVAKPEQGTAEYTYTGSPITFLLKNTQDQADYEVTGIEQTDVGTYTVTVALKDKTNCVWAGGTTDDISYQYQILPKELTAAMVTATVSYTYNGTTITPAVRVSDKDKELVKDTDYTLGGDISGTAVKSDYRMTVTGKGNYKGTVDVSWEITETPSDNTENILAEAKEIVTSKINGKEFTVSNLTTDKDIENAIRTALLKEDKTKKVVSEITVTKKAAEIEKAGKIAIAVKLSLNGKDITFDLNKEIPALVGKNITVTVKDEDDKAISGAEVKVMLGEIKKAENNSVADGKCTFSNLPAGLYNIVITKDRVTKTAIADLTTADAAVAVELDTTSKGSSHLTVKGEENTGTGEEADKKPKAATKVAETVVENLDVFTKALLDKEESEAVSDVESYRVDMYVEAKADTQISKSTQNEMVKEANKGETAAADKATNIDFLDISIIKTITKNSGKKESEQIADTGETVIEIIIPFNFTGKTNVKVLREHNGVVRKFDEIDNTATGADGTYKIDVTKGLIILYAKYFSTYAVSYVAEGESAIVEPVAPTYPFYPGGGSVSVTVPATGITIEADKF